jgi:hypothetical protein
MIETILQVNCELSRLNCHLTLEIIFIIIIYYIDKFPRRYYTFDMIGSMVN